MTEGAGTMKKVVIHKSGPVALRGSASAKHAG
ncbi:hypothetical protein FHU30_001257 [Actinomadura rupiterrae]|nr:hypothetical protein [Actinomadura rupiterrae]